MGHHTKFPAPSSDRLASLEHVTSVCIHCPLEIDAVSERDYISATIELELTLLSVKAVFPGLRKLHIMMFFMLCDAVDHSALAFSRICNVAEAWELEECVLGLYGGDVKALGKVGYIEPVKLPDSDEYVTYKNTSTPMYRCLDDVHCWGPSSRAMFWVVDDKVFQ